MNKTLKKTLSIMLSILMVVTMLPMNVLTASAAEDESDGVIYCDLGPWATPTLTALILKYSDDNSTINEIVMEEVGYNIWKADVSVNNPAGWRAQFLGSNQSTNLSSVGTTIPEGKNCFRITEYNSSSGGYDGVWYQYPCTSHDYKDGICACGEVCFHVNYTDGKCDVCSYECPHENQTGETCAVCGATLHTCDFSGEWKYNNKKHWKECYCGLTGEEGEHSWIFGKCTECGYACEHDFTNYEETEAPKCGVAGKEVAGCNNDCGAVNQREIPALTHKDDNGDNLCDNGCGSEFAVIEGETYVVLGDITYTGLNYYITDTPGCYKAGDGYAVIQPADTGTELILYNATIDVREEAVSGDFSENDAVCVYGDLNFTFIGTNNIYAKEGYDAFNSIGPSSEDTKLVINGTEGAVLNLYGRLSGYYITVKSGTVNVYEDDPDIVFAISAGKYFTVEKDAVVTAVGADNELFPNIGVLSEHGMTVEGVLNAFTIELVNAEEFSVALRVFGDVSAHQDIDVSLAAQEGAAIDLVIPEGASLTIPEGCTINLDSFSNVDIKGELIVNGTLICTHKGGEATCTEKAVCDVCGREYGEFGGHDWIRNILVRPTRNADGTWSDGYYYDKCKNDEAHNVVIGVAKRADYSAYDNACAKLSEYFSAVELTEAAVAEIQKSLSMTIMVPNNLVEGESSLAFMNNWVKSAETIIAKIESGEYVKADYTEIDEVIKAVDEALESVAISEEMAAELADIKAQLDTLKEDENATMADVIELNERLEAIAEIMDNCANGVHSFTNYAEVEAPECGKAGKEVAACDNGCGATDEKELPALTHKDDNGDYLCDNGCGHEFEKPGEPDKPTDDTCDHMCHKDGILGFIWKIISFLQRLFGIQQYCDCGELHYEKAIFG